MKLDRQNEYVQRLREALYELDVIASNAGNTGIARAALLGRTETVERLSDIEVSDNDFNWMLSYSPKGGETE